MLTSFLKTKKPTAAEEKETKKKADLKAKEEIEIDEAEELALTSKVVKTGNVEEFPWTYTETHGGKPVTKEVKDL